MSISAFPLSWPDGWSRTDYFKRTHGRFSKGVSRAESGLSWKTKRELTVHEAVRRVRESLERMGADDQEIIVSTNVQTRLDGFPRSGAREPDDGGAAVYWRTGPNAPTRCMAIDRYLRVADNLAAIAATLEAMRAIDRHGGAAILDRAFAGFVALPAPDADDWRAVRSGRRPALRTRTEAAQTRKWRA